MYRQNNAGRFCKTNNNNNKCVTCALCPWQRFLMVPCQNTAVILWTGIQLHITWQLETIKHDLDVVIKAVNRFEYFAIKGVLLCFFTFWILVCVVCMFGHKKICKVTNLKVHSKGRYFVFKKSLFKNYNERLVWTTKLFSCICDITKLNPAYGNSNGRGGGENAWLSTARFKIKTQCGCFYITVFLMETNCFQKVLDAIFEPPSMRACSSTPPKQNQDFVKEHNRTPLMFWSSCIDIFFYFLNEYFYPARMH